jgi:hypothetical protein
MAIVQGRWNKDGKPQGGGGNYGSDMGKFHLFPPIDLSPGGRTIQSSHFMRSARATYIERSEGNTFIFLLLFFH